MYKDRDGHGTARSEWGMGSFGAGDSRRIGKWRASGDWDGAQAVVHFRQELGLNLAGSSHAGE